MATLQGMMEDYVGTLSDQNAVTEWLTAGAKFIVDLLPDHVLNEYATTQNVTTGGLSLSTYRVLKALKNGYDALLVDSGMLAAIQDSNSIHYALASSPRSVYYNGKIYIYPNGGEVLAMAYPTASFDDQTISGFPARLTHGVILYAVIQSLLGKMCSELNTASALSAPTAPSAPSIAFVDVTGQTVTLPSAPSYTKPTTTFSATNLSSYINTANTEDLDQAQAEANHQKTLLEKFQMDLYNELNEVNAEIESYRGSLQKYIEDARLAQEAGVITKTKDLEAAISQYNAQLAKYQSEIQSYASQISGSANISQNYIAILDRVKAEFNDFINGIIRSNG